MSQYKYYVYHLIDPRTGIPFYVGKGTVGNGRMQDHIRDVRRRIRDGWNKTKSNNPHKDRVIRKILVAGYNDVGYEIIYRINNEDKAYQREIKEIAKLREKYGRDKITNITDGGDGADSETAYRAGCKGGRATAKRLKEDPEFAERMRKVHRENSLRIGYKGGQATAQRIKNDPEFAKFRRAIGERGAKERGLKGALVLQQRRRSDPELDKLLRAASRRGGRKAGFMSRGRKASEETRKKMSQSATRAWIKRREIA